jgi:hypothetical protein
VTGRRSPIVDKLRGFPKRSLQPSADAVHHALADGAGFELQGVSASLDELGPPRGLDGQGESIKMGKLGV